MSRLILGLAATFAAVAAIPQTPAAAQEPGIIVAAPRVPAPWQPKNTVRRQTVLRSHVFVPTADLNLRTVYGRYVLDRRLQWAAYEACDQLRGRAAGGVGSMMNPDPQNCRHNAYEYARRDASYLIYAAG